MPRPIAFSAKQKREQLQDKRAVERGELDPSEVRYARNPTGNYRPGASHLPDHANADTVRTRLISKFISVTPEYIERTRDFAHSVPLPRPVSDGSAVFSLEWMERDGGKLTCPVRPECNRGRTKEELERSENEMYSLWLKDTRLIVEDWVRNGNDKAASKHTESSLRSPSWFETNLEVWRQLWRVSELSQVLLLLADARCPALHIPNSLRTYIQGLQPRKEVILVLTKCDLVEIDALFGWKEWAADWWNKGNGQVTDKERHELQVITVQSVRERPNVGGLGKLAPDLDLESRKQLIEALQIAHLRLQRRLRPECTPTPSKPQGIAKPNIDWESLAGYPMSSQAPRLRSEYTPTPSTLDPGDLECVSGSEPLTIGLIGQPNVGKSSLLNSLLGECRVRVGRTPGKTKHFQTIYWGEKKEVRFVDCPGLVCPSLICLPLVLPINQIPSLPACISTVARLAPLELIFNIPQPQEPGSLDVYADKRTWRHPRSTEQISAGKKPDLELTAWHIIEGRALDRGFLTAKTGRPDITRAATGMMLALAEGKVRWCFYPPGSAVEQHGRGIWFPTGSATDYERNGRADSDPESG